MYLTEISLPASPPGHHKFQTKPSVYRARRLSTIADKEGKFEAALTVSEHSL